MHSNISAAPTSYRIDLLDILRGLAIFGILMVNMQIFYRPMTVMLAGYTGAESFVNIGSQAIIKFFFEGKFYVLFSFLFGYGFWMFINKRTAGGGSIIPVFRRRMLILLMIGILHVVLLWPGDILVFYALFGFLLILFRRKSDTTLLKWSAFFLLLPIVFTVFTVLIPELASVHPESKEMYEASIKEEKQFLFSFIDKAYEIYGRGSFSEIVSLRLQEYFIMLPGIFFFYPMVLAMFIAGVWGGRKRIIEDYRSNLPFFRKSLWVGLVGGILSNVIYTWSHFTAELVVPDIWTFISSTFHIVGGVLLCLFYVSAIVLLYDKGKISIIGRYLAPVGRMALTNYLLHSLICTTLFLPYGFGLFGEINVFQGVLLTIVIFAAQVLLSNVWLRYFRYGPFEWVWRSLTYMKRQPIKIRNAGS